MQSKEKVFVIVYRTTNGSVEYLALKPNPEPGRNSDNYVVTGGVEPYDASIEATALREVAEEIGIESKSIVDLNYIINYTDHITFKKYSEHCFGVKIGNEPIILNEEHIGYIWLAKNDFVKTIWWDYDKSILEKMVGIIETHET